MSSSIHEIADNSSISSPSLDYCGVQTPESSPHGSPIANADSLSLSARNAPNSSDVYRYSNSPRAFYNQNYLGPHQGSQMSEMSSKNIQVDYTKQSNLRDTIKSLPTPEMSPVENNDKDPTQQYQNYGLLAGHHKLPGQGGDLHSQMYQSPFHQYQYKTAPKVGTDLINSQANSQVKTENPFNELISRFSGSSTFLRNVCPPYAYRMQNREPVEEMQQRNFNSYLMGSKPLNTQFETPRSMLQHQLELPINESRTYRSWPNSNLPDNSTIYDMSRAANYAGMYNKVPETKGGEEMMYQGSSLYDTNMYYGQVPTESNFSESYLYNNSTGSVGAMTNSIHHGEMLPSMPLMNSTTSAINNYEQGESTTRHDSQSHSCDSSNSELIAALAETREIIS